MKVQPTHNIHPVSDNISYLLASTLRIQREFIVETKIVTVLNECQIAHKPKCQQTLCRESATKNCFQLARNMTII
ncbi:CLUMA_CG006207, isoform A [Clunio marinus]|uniref:CLUMA_CG006207, isoform A n=1 Tax=Clunio marinus TaxID=568069 RepID=A0A1J1HXC1_9DIPT|nr:CLUMA_CG006214, isoform A [Clunio marinus]CRK92638.1 CLUMA_CG006207, isoform A [Clunio marinus]